MDIQRNKAALASFLASVLLAAPVSALVDVNIGDLLGSAKWHPEPPPVLQKPCVVIDSVNNITYMLGYDSTGAIVFNFIQQSTCSANWTTSIWTSLPYPGGGKPYYTEQCFLTANHHFGVQFEGGIAVWNQWARTWTYETISCDLTYPNNLAPVFQDSTGLVDDLLVQWQDTKGVGHLTGIQLLNDTVHSCSQLTTTNVPTDMTLAAAPLTGKSFFLFGPKSSCWYDITAASSASDQPVQTTSDCQPLPAMHINNPRSTLYNGSIWIFGENNVGVGVWQVDTTVPEPYTIVPVSQGAPIAGNFTVANCGTGIIVYGGCDSADQCSTNLQPGEPVPPGTSSPPTVIFVPPTGGNNGGGGSGGGGSGGGGSGGGGSGGGGSGGGGSGGGGSGGGGSGGGGSGGGGSGGGGSGGGGSGGGGSGGGGSGGGGSGGGGSGGGGSGGGGSGGGGGGGGTWIPPLPTGIPTGPPSGGPSFIPPTATIGTATSGGAGVVPTGPAGVPDGSKTSGSDNHTGAIVGGIIGGVALICLIALMFLFARRKRRESEYLAGAGGHGGPEEVTAGHLPSNGGGLPPLIPLGPMTDDDLNQVVVDKEEVVGPYGPGGPGETTSYPGGPTGGSSFPGGPSDNSSFPGGPNVSGVVPPAGHNSHIPEIIGGAAVVGAIGAIAHHKKKEEREEVSHGHVAPVPVPVPVGGRPSNEYETTNGRGAPVPGGPSPYDSTHQPSGPGGIIPVGGRNTSTTETTTTEEITGGNSHLGRDVLLGGVAAGVIGGVIAGHRSESQEKIITSKTTVRVVNGRRVYTTTGTGGRTVVTEHDETTGAPRHVLTGIIPGTTTVRTITQRSETGEDILVPVDSPEGEEREVVAERDAHGNIIRYIIGGLIVGTGVNVVRHVIAGRTESETGTTTRIISGGNSTMTSSTKIVTERSSTGEIRYIIVGGFTGNAIRVITERSSTGETRLIPTNEPTGELRHVTQERTDSGEIRYIIGGIIAGSTDRTTTERTESGSVRVIPGGSISTVSSSTKIVTERSSNGEIRYIIAGGFSGNAIRVLTEKTSTGEIRLIPTNDEAGELRHVIQERTETGEIRYIIGTVITTKTITRVIMGPRIVTERTSTGEIRYVIVDQYNGNAIRTKFERNEETGEMVHIPVKEPEGELRYVTEETTETGEIRKVIGAVITGNVTTTTRMVSGGTVTTEGPSTSTQTRIVSETTSSGETKYYQITNGPNGEEIRTVVERTAEGGFRIPGGAVVVGAGATLVGNNHQTTTTTRVVGGGTLTAAEQAANRTQITLKLSIMRYERGDADQAVPTAAVGTVLFSKFRMLGAGDVNIDDVAFSHVEEVKISARRTIKWMKTEAHWKREAGMLQHLKSDRYIADLYTLYSLPTFASYRFVSILGPFSRTLESYMATERLSSAQIRQLTLSLSDALRWCHEHHVVHLNVRPASFYLEGVPGEDAQDGNGQLVWKLWNFGHARFVGEPVDTAVTTVTYAAPEILQGRESSSTNVLSAVSMDRWSLGLILYELHAGKPYFSASNFAEFQLTNKETVFEPALDTIREEDARKAIRGLLEVDPERRFAHETLREVYFGRS